MVVGAAQGAADLAENIVFGDPDAARNTVLTLQGDEQNAIDGIKDRVVGISGTAVGGAGALVTKKVLGNVAGNGVKGGDLSSPNKNIKIDSDSVPESVIRRDIDFTTSTKSNGQKKSYLDEEGNLVPANRDGNITVQQHIRGADPAKSNSQYTSTTSLVDTASSGPKNYGGQEIEIQTDRLQQDVDAGITKNVEVISPQNVQTELKGHIEAA